MPYPEKIERLFTLVGDFTVQDFNDLCLAAADQAGATPEKQKRILALLPDQTIEDLFRELSEEIANSLVAQSWRAAGEKYAISDFPAHEKRLTDRLGRQSDVDESTTLEYCIRMRLNAARKRADARPGAPCPRCKNALSSCSPSGRGTAACDNCQTVYGEDA